VVEPVVESPRGQAAQQGPLGPLTVEKQREDLGIVGDVPRESLPRPSATDHRVAHANPLKLGKCEAPRDWAVVVHLLIADAVVDPVHLCPARWVTLRQVAEQSEHVLEQRASLKGPMTKVAVQADGDAQREKGPDGPHGTKPWGGQPPIAPPERRGYRGPHRMQPRVNGQGRSKIWAP